ncbi:hypothetical protein QUF90_21205 [Desulfococcaceae bacterium HSG9]|nr:hypothetical protein [Desulfococcaceae bacterium HSG9]
MNLTTGGAAFNDTLHPTPEKRCAFLRTNMKAVKHDIDLFYIGVRLYQLGRHEDALAFIEDFRKKYPCREAFNNLGLIHYQMAVHALAKCDYDRACRFKLATMPDTETRAATLRSKGGAGDKNDECPYMAQFEYHIKYALRDLKTACEKDDAYIPARVNLASVACDGMGG